MSDTPSATVQKSVATKQSFFADADLAAFDDTMAALLKSGVHFGHQKSRRHPRMTPYIFATRGGTTIIDLAATRRGVREAQDFLVSVRKSGKPILFVTTKRQMLDLLRSAAERAGEPYVIDRWIGGTFTNFRQIRARVKSLIRMEEDLEKGVYLKYTKLEQLRKREEIEKMNRKMGGLKTMDTLPGAIVVVDVKADALAVREARKAGVPVVALTDTNVDPQLADYAIPANDDAISSVKHILGLLLKALDGVVARPRTEEKKATRRMTDGVKKQTARSASAKKGASAKAE